MTRTEEQELRKAEVGCACSLGHRVRLARVASGMTQAVVAKRLHVPRRRVSAWERGHPPPSEGDTLALCLLFGIKRPTLGYSG